MSRQTEAQDRFEATGAAWDAAQEETSFDPARSRALTIEHLEARVELAKAIQEESPELVNAERQAEHIRNLEERLQSARLNA